MEQKYLLVSYQGSSLTKIFREISKREYKKRDLCGYQQPILNVKGIGQVFCSSEASPTSPCIIDISALSSLKLNMV